MMKMINPYLIIGLVSIKQSSYSFLTLVFSEVMYPIFKGLGLLESVNHP